MTNTVSVEKYHKFNREKALANFRQKTVELSKASEQPEKQVTNTAERLSYEKEK